MDPVVIYVVTDETQSVELTVSLHSLRRWWSGDVVVCCFPECAPIVDRMSTDQRLNFRMKRIEEGYRDHLTPSSDFSRDLTKILAMRAFNDNVVLCLDPGTLIRGDISELISACRKGVMFTQDATLLTSHHELGVTLNKTCPIKNRPESVTNLVNNHRMKVNIPRLNSKVCGGLSNSIMLQKWLDLSLFCKDHKRPTDLAAQVLVQDSTDEMYNVMPGLIWNFDPECPGVNKIKDVIIWRYENKSFCRPDINSVAFSIWFPVYEACLSRDIGEINTWIDTVAKTDPCLTELRKQQ